MSSHKVDLSLSRMKAITLLEITVVIIIVGISAALGLPRLAAMRERALDKKAKANLKLIQAAQKVYLMKEGSRYPYDGGDVDAAAINESLQLSLPTGDPDWEYTAGYDCTDGTCLDARATRINPPWDRVFGISEARDEACCVSGTCPPGMTACPGGP